MSIDINRLLQDAMSLSERDRAELAGRLLETLDVDFDDTNGSWQKEIRDRITELDNGVKAPIPGVQALEILRGEWNDPPRT